MPHDLKHVAVIMDGNGRWAVARGLPRIAGYGAGYEAIVRCVRAAVEFRVPFLTLFAFSTENWRRPATETRAVLEQTQRLILQHRDEFNSLGIRLRWIGQRDRRIPKRFLNLLEQTVEMTAGNAGLTLTVAINYGGRTEITEAARSVLGQVGSAQFHRISPKTVQQHLYAPELPDVDLLIRTGGELRISNFLLWQIAYAEMFFTKVMWPDFRREHLKRALQTYQKRRRTFGKR